MINALTVRTGGDPTAVEDVIVGSVSTAVGFRASVAAENRASAVEGMTIWRDVSRAAEARAAMTVNANILVVQLTLAARR